MALVPELTGPMGSFILSDVALLRLGPSSYLSMACWGACVPGCLGSSLRSLHNVVLHKVSVL